MASKKLPGGDARAGLVIVKDPEVRIGALRLLQRTDGKWIAVDEKLPPGEQAVRMSDDREVVERWMKAQAEKEAKDDAQGDS